MNRKNKKKIVVKSRVRFTIFVVIMMVISVSAFNTVAGFNDAKGSTEKQYIQVEVSNGDTLWNIASTYMDNCDDTRKAVHQICQINNIEANDLHEGMTLNIPEEL